MIRAVIDTNVVLQGLTHRGDPGRIIEAWRDRRFLPCVSTALALE
jgi:predicted nucleic acid-binding protein